MRFEGILNMERDRTILDAVIIRHIGLCSCCGFEASEVHHITPLVFGGKDDLSNLTCLCRECHKQAPNTKEEFEEYKKEGGGRTTLIYGKLTQICLKLEKESKGELKFIDLFNQGREIINALRECDLINAIEKYEKKLKKSLTGDKFNGL
jgi:hypothetical protein